MTTIENRRHRRLRYPPGESPLLLLDGKRYSILDLSETGVRYDLGGNHPPVVRTTFAGQINFADGGMVIVKGQIARVGPTFVCLSFSQRVPKERMVAEYERLAKRYPPDALL